MGEDQDVVLKRVAVNPVHDNNKPQHRNVLAPNQNKDKKPMQKHDNACINYGMNKHWARACRTLKHFVELYQAFIKGKGKRIESHSVDNAKYNIEVNNILVLHRVPISEVSLAPMEAISLEILDFIDN